MGMKRLSLIVLIVTASLSARGQDSTRKNMFAIKTNLLLPALTILLSPGASLSLEKGFKKRHSVQLTGSYLTIFTLKEATSEYRINIVEEYRYFLSRKNNFRGFYLGSGGVQAFDNYIDHDHDMYDDSSYSYWQFGAIGFVGFQNYSSKRIVFDFIGGGGITWPYWEAYIRLGINIGYRF